MTLACSRPTLVCHVQTIHRRGNSPLPIICRNGGDRRTVGKRRSKVGKQARGWRHLFWTGLGRNAFRFQRHRLAGNLSALPRGAECPEKVADWLLTGIQSWLINIGACVLYRSRARHCHLIFAVRGCWRCGPVKAHRDGCSRAASPAVPASSSQVKTRTQPARLVCLGAWRLVPEAGQSPRRCPKSMHGLRRRWRIFASAVPQGLMIAQNGRIVSYKLYPTHAEHMHLM